jgi:uncharacterized membrane protein YcgQ (UPF0703/DUF1980 family)
MKLTKIFIVFCILAISAAAIQKEPDLWGLFAKTRFTEKLNRQLSMYFLYPSFPAELMEMEGKEITLSGFYIPLDMNDDRTVILSKFPMAQCFFCGGAGSESVAVAYLKDRHPKKIKTDQIIKVRGRLSLNDKDVDELTFIIKDAKIIP